MLPLAEDPCNGTVPLLASEIWDNLLTKCDEDVRRVGNGR